MTVTFARQLKIAHIVYTPRLSGAEVLVSLLLPEHLRDGHETVLISLNPAEGSFTRLHAGLVTVGVPCVFPTQLLTRYGRVRFIRGVINKYRPDVIFAHSLIPSGYARWAVRNTGVPVITVMHDASRDDYRSLFFRLTERYLLPAPSYVVAVADEALKNYRLRISPFARGCVIENAINIAELQQLRARRELTRREELGFEADVTVFASVGRYAPQKNQELLIAAFSLLPAKLRAKSRLLLIGITENEEYERRIRAMAEPLGDGIVFMSNRPDSLALLACADVYCMPSLNEGFSLAYLEGMALEVNVLASDIPAFRFAAAWPGVKLLPLSDASLWADQMVKAAQTIGHVHVRPLDKYSASFVARLYEKTASEVLMFSNV